MHSVLPFTVAVVLAATFAQPCAADPLRQRVAFLGAPAAQAVPASQLSQIRGSGISAPVVLDISARIRLWDELQRRTGSQAPSQPGMSAGTLTITIGTPR